MKFFLRMLKFQHSINIQKLIHFFKQASIWIKHVEILNDIRKVNHVWRKC
jgi:hypothetical protein